MKSPTDKHLPVLDFISQYTNLKGKTTTLKNAIDFSQYYNITF